MKNVKQRESSLPEHKTNEDQRNVRKTAKMEQLYNYCIAIPRVEENESKFKWRTGNRSQERVLKSNRDINGIGKIKN